MNGQGGRLGHPGYDVRLTFASLNVALNTSGAGPSSRRTARGASGYHDEVFHDDDHVLRTPTKLLDDASSAQRKLDPADGLQDAQLDNGARVHIVHGDVARGGHVLVNVRKFTGIPQERRHPRRQHAPLDQVVERREPGLCAGPALDRVRRPSRRRKDDVYVVHRCRARPSAAGGRGRGGLRGRHPLPNVAHMQTRAARSDREPVDLRRLVAGFLRMAPDVAIVGEVRDREGLPEIRAHGCHAV
jgi:pilus assembly protein CpaF